MGLEEIIGEIEKRANKDVEKIKKQLQEERKKILERAEEEALRLSKEIVKRLENGAQSMKRGRIIGVRVEEKKELLALKRKLLAESFKQAEEEVRSLSKQEYMSLMKYLLVSNIDSGNEEIVVSAPDEEWMKGDFLKELRKSLEKKGRWKEVRLTAGLREGERGFILKKEGVHLNYTFASLFLLLREELEIEVANSLLG